ncbi:MAG: hypothetical protein Q9206_005560 [Seirophora lacunosa]
MLRDEVESDFDYKEVPDPDQKVQSPCTTLRVDPPAINHEADSSDTDHEVESPYIDAELPLPDLDSKVQPPYIHHEIQLSLEEDESCQSLEEASAADIVQLPPQTKQTKPRPVHFGELPIEVLDRIVSYLAGPLMGLTSKSSCGPRGPRNTGQAMWHPRRKQLSDLALVSVLFKDLMQQRIYRHVKVKGTASGLKECREWFRENPHLRAYVRHFEVWIPVWEVKARRRPTEIPPIPSAFTPRPDMRGERVNGRALTFKGDISDMTQGFQQSTQNAALEDILELTRDIFSELYVLTLEGGQAYAIAQGFRDPSRLQSVDIIVRNCCRPGAYPGSSSDATGIYQPDFIAAFIRLVTEAIRALVILTSVNYLRIRYLDLDSPRPMLNPYFHLQGTSVKGIYNFEINRLLRDARPYAEWDDTDIFDETFESYGNCLGTGYVDHLLKAGRPRRIDVDAYTALLYDAMQF